MPIENIKFGEVKVFYRSNEDDELKELEEIKELKAESIEVCNDDVADAIRYYAKTVTNKGYSAELTLSKEASQKLLKAIGENRITRKRFIKLLMGYGIQRNNAQNIAEFIHIQGWKYTPNMVKIIIAMTIWKGDKKQYV